MLEQTYAELYESYNIEPMRGLDTYPNLVAIYNEAVKRYHDKPAIACMGKTLNFNEFDRYASQLAAYLHNNTDLEPGDRIAVMLPNILQQPISTFAILRAGYVLVNTNPLYTPRELEHQLNDSGAKAVIILANMAHVLDEVLPHTSVKHVIVTQVGDMHPMPKRLLINSVLKYVRKQVPPYKIPHAVGFRKALELGSKSSAHPVSLDHEDVAVLQYTGGTTGLSKGAVLTHKNLIANCLQLESFMPGFGIGYAEEVVVQPLPLYHIYAFTFTLRMISMGNLNVLIPNPRDLPSLVSVLEKTPYTVFCGLNTLFVALMNNVAFRRIEFDRVKVTISGGMALTQDTADQWKQITGKTISEGYGLTECSPVVTFNPAGGERIGSIGVPLPNTVLKVIDDQGQELGLSERGELCIQGPQVMREYWNNPEATEKVFYEGDWLATGDIAIIEKDGYVRIVDRKKDMILVSGFNVYPNEVEDELSKHPHILECAAIGVPDDTRGETVKVFVVKVPGKELTKEEVLEFARESLTGYKVPKAIEFREELPKSNVGKILRRKLRDEDVNGA